jgi:hypothetical protein
MNGDNNQSIPPFKYVQGVLGMCFPFHNFMLFCIKFFVQQIYGIINLYVLLIMEVFTRIIIFFPLNNLYKKNLYAHVMSSLMGVVHIKTKF